MQTIILKVKIALLNIISNMSIQLLIHFNKMFTMKLLKESMLRINMKVNVSTKTKTHYDVLKVPINATHNEIKSAYYNLTMQYHPDKNKSDAAKVIFQEISQAYEILSNYKLRKQYDRSIAVKHGNVNQVQRPRVIYNNPPSSHKIYNFDEWADAHYQSTLKKEFQKKKDYKVFVKFREENEKDKKTLKFSNVYTIVLLIAMVFATKVLYGIQSATRNDQPVDKKID